MIRELDHLSVRSDWKDRRDRLLIVPGELLSVYQPSIGPQATLAWLNLAYLLQEVGVVLDPIAELQNRQGLTREEARTALARLMEVKLLEPAPEGGFVLREPSTRGRLASSPQRLEPLRATPAPGGSVMPSWANGDGVYWQPPAPEDGEEAAAAAESEPGASPAGGYPASASPDAESRIPSPLQAVVDFYQKRIGMLGPVQYEKLRFWVEEKRMSPDVVAVAIEETVTMADSPRIQYLEGILRNWYNEGIRTMKDLIESNRLPRALAGQGAADPMPASSPGGPRRHARSRRPAEDSGRPPLQEASHEGIPNAAAYRKVDAEQIRRWKALHPEEYADS